MQFFEYSIELGTGERIDITEISIGALSDEIRQVFFDPEFLQTDIMSLCTKMPHAILEDAKIGYTKPFECKLSTPPIGALIKIHKPMCAEIDYCAMADKQKCTTRAPKFPECWVYTLNERRQFMQEIVSTIVMAWRDNRYVIISE